jgi:hypothetical protein
MSTRTCIKITDDYCKDGLWFYRHSDGYPEVTLITLCKFMDWVVSGKIRDNANQASGWLVILGHTEYEAGPEPRDEKFYCWKVGAYEPTDCAHGDIEWLYVLDLPKREIVVYKVTFGHGPVEKRMTEIYRVTKGFSEPEDVIAQVVEAYERGQED